MCICMRTYVRAHGGVCEEFQACQGNLFFPTESDDGVHFTPTIEIKELRPISRNPGSHNIKHLAPPGGEKSVVTAVSKFCGHVCQFRITQYSKSIGPNPGNHVPPGFKQMFRSKVGPKIKRALFFLKNLDFIEKYNFYDAKMPACFILDIYIYIF